MGGVGKLQRTAWQIGDLGGDACFELSFRQLAPHQASAFLLGAVELDEALLGPDFVAGDA
ncbi:hypothetical protein ACFZAV_43360 [Streptomyces sp. NPDC008343]|uniref:hypothetical protein n=1 Tax=Streptomyces sp. NPDC008343 TaxID=3364828 RepID=UPI0036F16169